MVTKCDSHKCDGDKKILMTNRNQDRNEFGHECDDDKVILLTNRKQDRNVFGLTNW